MSHSNIIIKLKNDAESVTAFPNKKKEFYIALSNISPNYLPQARIRIEGPPQLKYLIKSEWYGGVASGKTKKRLFSIIPREEGIFKLTASLSSKSKLITSVPLTVRVGNKAITQKVSEPLKSSEKEKIKKVNCPFCHELIDGDSSFCPQCGAEVQKKLDKPEDSLKSTKFCVKCGTELPSDAKFCAKCGTKQK